MSPESPVLSPGTRDRRNGDMAACEDPRSTCHTSHMLPQPLGEIYRNIMGASKHNFLTSMGIFVYHKHAMLL